MRRRVTAVFAVGIAAFVILDLAVVLVLWPQLRRAEALSSRYAANSRLLSEMVDAIQVIRSSVTQHHVEVRTEGTSDRGDGLSAEIGAARQALASAAAGYARTPMNAGEAEVWARLSRDVLPAFERATEEVDAPSSGPGSAVDPMSLDRLRAVTNEAVAMLGDLAQLNAAALDATGKRMHEAVLRLVAVCIALGTAGVAGWLMFARWALAAVDEFERTTSERLEELDQFAGRVAHDLRNPLQAMSLSLAAIYQRADDDRTRATIAKAQGAAKRMGTFIQELLEFARSGANPEPGASACVHEVLRSVEQDLAPSAAEKGVTVNVGAPEHLRAAIGPDALRAIVGNLADNAVKHMPAGREPRRVDLGAARRGEEIQITVRDTGFGIAPEALPRIFEPFYRATTRPGGFGIGLKTVKRLVDAHGGRISVESVVGQGTTFTVALPAAPDAAPPRERAGSATT